MSRSAERGARYTTVAIALHWLIALAILAMLAIGLTMTHVKLAPVDKFKLYQLHKSIGLTILALAVLRLGWRLVHRPPALPAAMPAWERGAAEGTHVLLYGFMIGLPLLGWAMVSASPFNLPTVLYGVLPWPHLPIPYKAAAAAEPVLRWLHAYGAYALLGFVVLHAGAALRHALVKGDDILQRMLPRLPRLGGGPATRISR